MPVMLRTVSNPCCADCRSDDGRDETPPVDAAALLVMADFVAAVARGVLVAAFVGLGVMVGVGGTGVNVAVGAGVWVGGIGVLVGGSGVAVVGISIPVLPG
jgi:hypothetical protein